MMRWKIVKKEKKKNAKMKKKEKRKDIFFFKKKTERAQRAGTGPARAGTLWTHCVGSSDFLKNPKQKRY